MIDLTDRPMDSVANAAYAQEVMDVFAGVLPLVTLADTGSFRRAARSLGVTPSAVSKAIARLERELGVRLVHRTSRALALTPEGTEVVAGFRDAVDRVRAARALASAAQQVPTGHLRVTWPLPLASMIADRVLPRMVALYPRVDVHAIITDRLVDLVAENVDLAIRIGPVADSRLVARRLGSIRWVTAAAPSFLARHGTPRDPSDLARFHCLRFVLPSGIVDNWQFVDAAGKDLAVTPSGPFTADHADALVAAALAGVGIVQTGEVMVADHLASGALVEILTDRRAPGPLIHALTAPGRNTSPKVRAFADLAAEILGR